MSPAGWSISNSSRSICSSFMPHEKPEILDTATARVLDKAARLGVLAPEDADVLRPAVRLYQNLTQILRLCLSGPFDPKAAGPGLLSLLARAGDVPDFATLEAHLAETQAQACARASCGFWGAIRNGIKARRSIRWSRSSWSIDSRSRPARPAGVGASMATDVRVCHKYA